MTARDLPTVIETLRLHQSRLEQMGVVHAAIYGSLARGDANAASDIDVVVEIDPEKKIGVCGFVGVLQYLQDLFGPDVDIIERRGSLHLCATECSENACMPFRTARDRLADILPNTDLAAASRTRSASALRRYAGRSTASVNEKIAR
jgi:predicted nucleotidyltransferase